MAGLNQEKNIADYMRAIKRRKWQFIIPSMILFAIIVTIAVMIPSIYRSSAIILIEQQDIPSDMVQSTITSFADERIQIISQRVMTTTNLTQVMNKYDLYKVERQKLTREEIINKMRNDISLNMISAEVIDPRSGHPTEATIAFKLAYENRSPALSQKVTNELVSLYLNENLKSRTEKAAEATGFLAEEAARLRSKIEEIELKLARFKEKHTNSLPQLSSLNMSLLERTERELFEVDRQITSSEERKLYLESQLEQMSPAATLYSDNGQRILTPQGRLKQLETRYLSASAIYAEDHPDLIRMRRELSSLREEVGDSMQSRDELEKIIQGLSAELAEMEKTHSADHPDIKQVQQRIISLKQASLKAPAETTKEYLAAENPAYIQLKVKLEAVNTDLRSLQENRGKLNRKLNEIEARLIEAPQVEREYRSMTRDHNNAVAKYQEITTKQMSARLAEELEKDSKGERFSLIEPPLLPEKPVKPNRQAIVLLGAIVSLGIGLGIVFLLDSLDKSIRTQRDISLVVGMQPLATIPYIVTESEVRGAKRNRLMFFVSTGVIITIFFTMAHFFYKPLDILWFVVMRKLGF